METYTKTILLITSLLLAWIVRHPRKANDIEDTPDMIIESIGTIPYLEEPDEILYFRDTTRDSIFYSAAIEIYIPKTTTPNSTGIE